MWLKCHPPSLGSVSQGLGANVEDFQDRHPGSHLGQPNGTILAILNLYVTVMLPITFRLKPAYSLGGDAYARSGVNQMWILKNSKELLGNLKAQSLHSVNSIKSFDFSTLYTTIPHDKLKSKLKEIINQCFFHKNGNLWFQYVVIGYKYTYFVRDHSDAP